MRLVCKSWLPERRSGIVQGVTETLVRVLDKNPEHTHILIDEVDESRWRWSVSDSRI